MIRPRTVKEAYANPGLVRDLERQLSVAAMKAQSMGALVCQGRATHEEKDLAFAAAAALQSQLAAEQKNVVAA